MAIDAEIAALTEENWQPLLVERVSAPEDGQYSLVYDIPRYNPYEETVDGVALVPEDFAVVRGKVSVPRTSGRVSADRATGALKLVTSAGRPPANLSALKLKFTARTAAVPQLLPQIFPCRQMHIRSVPVGSLQAHSLYPYRQSAVPPSLH